MQRREFEYQGHWLWRRKDTPIWYVYWCRQGSRRVCRRSTHTEDPEEAKSALIAFVHAKEGRQKEPTSEVPIREALNRYVEVTLHQRPSQAVAKGALKHLDRFFNLEHVVFIADVTLDVQERYIEWRRERMRQAGYGGSNGTIARELGVLRAALKEYWKRGYIESVPFVRSVPQPPPRQRFLTPEEVRRLLAECREPHLYRFTMVGLHTLQRPSAILELRCDQVDLASGRIDFMRPGRVQSNKRRPVVPISSTLRPILVEAIKESESGYVIEWRGQPLKCVRLAFKRAAVRAGLTDVSPYTLRHTGATLLAGAGVPLRQVAGMLGHSEMKTTEMYAKHSPEFLRSAAAAMDWVFGPQTDSERARVQPGVDKGLAAGVLPLHGGRSDSRTERRSERRMVPGGP